MRLEQLGFVEIHVMAWMVHWKQANIAHRIDDFSKPLEKLEFVEVAFDTEVVHLLLESKAR